MPCCSCRPPLTGGLVLAVLAFSIAPAYASGPNKVALVERSEADLVLLDVFIDHERYGDSLEAFHHPGGTYIPLGELAQTLDLGIRVSPTQGTASGFVFREDRHFRLDVVKHEVEVAGRRETIAPGLVEVHQNDIYIDSTLVARWFPLDLQIEPFASRLNISPREPLPAQMRKLRELQPAFQKATSSPRSAAKMAPYGWLGWPTIDPSLAVSLQPNADGRPVPKLAYAATAAGEVMFMSHHVYVAGDETHPLNAIRGSLGRKDPNGTMLGFMQAREVTLGALTNSGLQLMSSPRQGMGLTISNFPLDRPLSFDTQDLRGDLPPGWDVELYNNNSLVGYQRAQADGRYAFEGVTLMPGANELRLVFYGPQGQRREEVKRLFVGTDLTPPGEVRYRFAGGIWGQDNQPGATIQCELGLLRQLSLGLAVASLPDASIFSRQDYAQLGLQGALGEFFLSGAFAADLVGHGIGEAGIQTRLGPLGVSVKHSRMSALRPLELQAPERSQTTGRLDAAIQLPGQFGTSGSLVVQHNETDGSGAVTFSLPLSLRWGNLSVSNRLNAELSPSSPQGSLTGGTLQFGTGGKFGVRGEVNYSMTALMSYALTLDGRVWNDYHYNLVQHRS